VVDLGREVHRAAARVVVVGEGPGTFLDRDLLEAIAVEDAAGNLGAGHPVGRRYLEIARKRALHPVLGPEADDHGDDERDEESHGRIVATRVPVAAHAFGVASRS
jgi:hypothetical protein